MQVQIQNTKNDRDVNDDEDNNDENVKPVADVDWHEGEFVLEYEKIFKKRRMKKERVTTSLKGIRIKKPVQKKRMLKRQRVS